MNDHRCVEVGWCLCDSFRDTPNEDCLKHGAGPWPPRCAKCGRFLTRLPLEHWDTACPAKDFFDPKMWTGTARFHNLKSALDAVEALEERG